MRNQLLDKLAKIQELINRGVDGEKQNAELLFNKIVKKHGLSENEINSINITPRIFKYGSLIEKTILVQVIRYFYPSFENEMYRYKNNKREIYIKLNHFDFIAIETAYEYFRGHAKAQYKANVLPIYEARKKEINDKLVVNARVSGRKEYEYMTDEQLLEMYTSNKSYKKIIREYKKGLDSSFQSDYIIKSNLYRDEDLTTNESSSAGLRDYLNGANIEGGTYNKQVTTGLYLD